MSEQTELSEELKEVLDALYDVICQTCTDGDHLDSMAISSYAEALGLLSKHGYVDIVHVSSHRWIIAVPKEPVMRSKDDA